HQSREEKLCNSAGVSVRATTASSSEKIRGGGANQVAGPPWSGIIPESSNDTRWRAPEFAAHQSSGTSEFVGNGLYTDAKEITAQIFFPTIVMEHFHAGYTNGDFGQAFAPGASKTVGDDHRYRDL